MTNHGQRLRKTGESAFRRFCVLRHDIGKIKDKAFSTSGSVRMIILAIGLLFFLGIHLVPILPGMRNRLLEHYGEKTYKGMFSLVSAIGLALIVIGYARAPEE